MPDLSRSQVVVYGAVAVAVLLLGARAIRAEDGTGVAAGNAVSFTEGGDEGGGAVEVGASGADVVVDVAGAVRSPGVYRLPSGARVLDAIDRAGGATGVAALQAINRAARLTDGQQVVVPERGPGGEPTTGSGGADPEGPVSLGSASAEQLEEIDGIGPVTAEAIVEYRDERGGLASVEQLEEVSGIGPATMESLRDGLRP